MTARSGPTRSPTRAIRMTSAAPDLPERGRLGAAAALAPGDGIGVELLMDHGRPLAAFQHRRIQEVPPTGGASALRESVELDPDLYDHAVALLRELGWTGLAMVEFRRGADGVGNLMEINGRVWGSCLWPSVRGWTSRAASPTFARRVAALRSAGRDRLSTRCPGTEPAARHRVDRGRAVRPSPPRRTAMARTTRRDRRRGEPRRSAHRRRPDDVVGPGSWPRPDPDHRTRFPRRFGGSRG